MFFKQKLKNAVAKALTNMPRYGRDKKMANELKVSRPNFRVFEINYQNVIAHILDFETARIRRVTCCCHPRDCPLIYHNHDSNYR